jgi:hypothetical protein
MYLTQQLSAASALLSTTP